MNLLCRNLIILIITLIECYKSSNCPQIQTYHSTSIFLIIINCLVLLLFIYVLYQKDPQFSDGLVVKNFLKIPKTNIILINTIQNTKFDTSVVYYNDISTNSGEIINVVKPDYIIYSMDYIPQTDKLLLSNKQILVIADLYTLKSEKSIPIQYISTLMILPNTKYALLTNEYNQVIIFDIFEAKAIQTITNLSYSDTSIKYQYFSDLYKFKNGDQAIFTSNQYGIYSWNIDLDTLDCSYNGYLKQSIMKAGDRQRPFTKHPTQDIIFVGESNLQVIALKINNIKTGDVTVLLNTQIYIGTRQIIDLMFSIINKQGVNSSVLFAGDKDYICRLELTISDDGSTVQMNPKYNSYSYTHSYSWYPLKESTIIVMPNDQYVTFFDYQLETFNFHLFFKSDGYSRRFMRQKDGLDLYILPQTFNLWLSERGNVGFAYKTQKPNLSRKFRSDYNSVCRVKDCYECFFLKAGDTSDQTHYILTTLIFPFNTKDYALDITTTYKLKWDNINLNLDPFYIKDSVWVVLGFPKKLTTEDYLFQLINAYSKTERYFLKSTNSNDNKKQTSLALASIEDKTNLEIIGIDVTGTIYVWDLNIPSLAFKYSIKMTNFHSKFIIQINTDGCPNSFIGDIFQYQKLKRLIISCGDFTVYSFDFVKGEAQQLVKLTSNPTALRAFSEQQLTMVGDKYTGDAYIFKFNPTSLLFELFLKITTGKFKDNLLSFELLNDNTLWIQYNYSNLFYSLQDCLNDKNACTQCTQSYNFKATEQYDQNGIYGKGTSLSPFTTSANFFTAMIKAQYYKELTQGVSNMSVDMIIEPNLILKLQPGLLTFDFNSVISLTFKSKSQGEFASLQYLNQFKLQNYNYISFQDILIKFDFDKNKQQCGFSFIDIPIVILNNFQLQSLDVSPISCQQIYVQNSLLQILKYDISGEDFTQSSSLISTFNSTKIEIKKFSLKNCILGEKFNILNQLTNIELNIETVYISDNKCSLTDQDNKFITSLFSAGLFTVKDVHLTRNEFCKKTIFSTVALLQHTNQVFDFQDIEVKDNIFKTRTNYIFFNSLYSMKSSPSHELKLTRFTFTNNNLIKGFQDDLQIASFIQTNKISKITINNSIIKNHFDIQLGFIEYATEVSINEFQCYNDDSYNDNNIKDQITIGCIQLNEVNSVNINKISIKNKKANDNSLFIIENYNLKNAALNIAEGEFSNLILNQQKINTFANPIQIRSSYQIDIILDNCNFQNNKLNVISNSLTFSASGIWIENIIGQVLIKNSIFENSYSKSVYGFLYIQSYYVILENVNFNKSTFLENSESSQKEMFLQNGGMMNLKVKIVTILNSSFSKATSFIGSFIYIQSFDNVLEIDIKNTHFEEGYSKFDGSSLFIDTKESQLIFNCIDCFFNNLYSLNPKSSVIGMEQVYFFSIINELKKEFILIYQLLTRKYQMKKDDQQNIINFQGGNIINVFGAEDNYFIEGTNTHIQFTDIPIMQSDQYVFTSLAHQQYQKIQNQQQSTLMNLINSKVDLTNCNIQNLKINNKSSTFPLLINSENSSINFDNTSVQNSIFVTSAINSLSSSIILKKTKFINVNQISKSRIVDVSQDLQPNKQASSLIIITNGSLKVEQDCQFTKINCLKNCNGGVFQLLNSNFSIKDTSVNNAQATFGGAIFIFGIKDENLIENISISGGKSQNDGGAIYLHSISSDIDGSKFLSNESIDGKGGAIKVSSESLNSQLQSIVLTNSVISGNKAKIGGGLQQTNISVDIKNNSKIEQNIGEIFGNDEISYPSHLRLSNLNEFLAQNPKVKVENNMIVFDDFRSGAKLENLVFKFWNDKNEQIKPITWEDFNNYKIFVKFNPSTQNIESYTINSETTISYNKTLNNFLFRELQLIGTPLSTATLQFQSDQIKVLNKKTNKYEDNYSFLVKINFRNCTTGEKQAVYNELKKQTQCSICEPGFYSYFVQNKCQECPIGATCKGGSEIETKEGYWRKTNESSIVIQCSNLLENCVGGSYGDMICYEGHIGALCEECDIDGQQWGYSYSKSAKFQCTRCNKIKYNIWKVLLLTIWAMISMTIAIKGGIESVREKAAILALQKSLSRRSLSQLNQRSKSLSLSKKISFIQTEKQEKSVQSNQGKTGIFIKMLTNYLQIVGSIATFNLQIPTGIFEFPHTVGEPLRQTMNSLDCVLQDLDTSIPIIYLKLIFSLFIPFLYLILFLIGITIYFLTQKQKKFPWYILSTAIMFLIIYVQPDLVGQIIALISCRTVGETSYILSNVSYECYTDEHIFYILVLIAPLLLVWVFILPIILFLMLRKNKNELDSIEIKLKYGFLYREYKNYAFYWEFIKMAEKIAIILCLNFYSQSIPIKAVLVYIIILVYGVLTLKIAPYKEQDVNQVDINLTNICAITVLLALFMYNNPFIYYIYISLILIVLINAWFIGKIVKKIASGYMPMIEQRIATIIKKLSIKMSYFQKFVKTKKEKRINPELKKKVQNIFHQFIQMKAKEKKTLVMKILESQISENFGHVFGDELINSQEESQKVQLELSNDLKNIETPKTLFITDQKQQLIEHDDNWQLDNQENQLTRNKTETVNTLFGKINQTIFKLNERLDTEPTHLIRNDENPEVQDKRRYSKTIENIIKGDDGLIHLSDSETED